MRSAWVARGAIASILPAALCAAQEGLPLPTDGNAYVRSVIAGARPPDAAINDYAYDLEQTRENLDKEGRPTSRDSRAYEVYFVQERPVRRLVSRNGIRLGAREQAAVDQKAREDAIAIAEGRTVSEQPGIRLKSLVDSFDFQAARQESREGRTILVFDFRAKEAERGSASGRASHAIEKILVGQLHIDEADRRVVLLDARNARGQKANVATSVRLGAFELVMEFTRVESGVWLPGKVVTLAAGRAFLFKTFRIRQTTTYSNYRRFKVETEERTIR